MIKDSLTSYNYFNSSGYLENRTLNFLNSKLSSTEIDFVLTKLRQANYKGVEFEMFYTVFKKLTDMKK